jgi:3-hydroxyacyl-CoA dehydrogenase
MVSSGNLGIKTGKGFYAYEAGSKDLKVAPEFLA